MSSCQNPLHLSSYMHLLFKECSLLGKAISLSSVLCHLVHYSVPCASDKSVSAIILSSTLLIVIHTLTGLY